MSQPSSQGRARKGEEKSQGGRLFERANLDLSTQGEGATYLEELSNLPYGQAFGLRGFLTRQPSFEEQSRARLAEEMQQTKPLSTIQRPTILGRDEVRNVAISSGQTPPHFISEFDEETGGVLAMDTAFDHRLDQDLQGDSQLLNADRGRTVMTGKV